MPVDAGQVSPVQKFAHEIAIQNGLESKPTFTRTLLRLRQICISLMAVIVACSLSPWPHTAAQLELTHAPWFDLTSRKHCLMSYACTLLCGNVAAPGSL